MALSRYARASSLAGAAAHATDDDATTKQATSATPAREELKTSKFVSRVAGSAKVRPDLPTAAEVYVDERHNGARGERAVP